jgi:CRP/FNR family transcriptional regulator, cyclic AMP receptor protein
MHRSTAVSLETLGCAPLFQQLTPEELQRLACVAQRRTYRRREVIFHQGEPLDRLYVLEDGCVALTVRDTEKPRAAMLRALAAGEVFGEFSLVTSTNSTYTAEALGPVAVLALPRDWVRPLLWAHPEAIELLLQLLSEHIQNLAEMIAERSFLELEDRLTRVLLRLARQHGRRVGEIVELQLPLTQVDLAALLGATRTSVNRVLGLYEEQRLIRRPGSRVMLVDVPRLEQLLV